ncbi:MAG: hypothetical protein M3Y80_09645 [Verrucomicrobiota bacterium]|nr:hypothetical protein [Verrucomicrobiota bacterium]
MQPTLLLAPAPFDLHPDHNAFSVLVQFALAAEEFRNIERLSYAVHTRGYHANCEPVALPLMPLEQRVKRLAILRHRTQMALSRRRFMAHVTHRELFWRAVAPPETDVRHPVRAVRSDAGGITVELERAKRAGSFARCTLCLAVEDAHGRHAGWLLPLPRSSRTVPFLDAATKTVLGHAEVEIVGRRAFFRLPTTAVSDLRRIFARLKQPTLFYDRAGWRELPLVFNPTADASEFGTTANSPRRSLVRATVANHAI